MRRGYGMRMMMKRRLFRLCALAGVATLGIAALPAGANRGGGQGSGPGGGPGGGAMPFDQAPLTHHRSDQDSARRAMLEGNVMPFSVLKRRVEQRIGPDAEYLGSDFLPESNSYRLKYMRGRNVVWVDVDGRTGDIIGMAR